MKLAISLIVLLLFSGSAIGRMPQLEIDGICTEGSIMILGLALLRDGGTPKIDILDKIYEDFHSGEISEGQAIRITAMTNVVYKYPEESPALLSTESYTACQLYFDTENV